MLMSTHPADKSVPSFLTDDALKRNNPSVAEEKKLKRASVFFWILMSCFAVLSIFLD